MNRERQGFHISHVYSLWREFSHHTTFFDLVTLTLKFDLLFKNFNLGHDLWTTRDRSFIFPMFIPWDKFFDTIPQFLTYWPWPLSLTYFWNFNLGHNLFIPCDKTFHIIPYFWPSDLDLEIWIMHTKCFYLNLVASRQTSLSSDNSCFSKVCKKFLFQFSSMEIIIMNN